MRNLVFLIGMSLVLSSCDWMFFWQDDEEVKPEETAASTPPAPPPPAEVKKPVVHHDDDEEDSGKIIARLNVRIEQLEAQVKRQREDFHILRKGLMTGLVPSEWRDDLPKYSKGMEKEVEGENLSRSYKNDSLAVMLGSGEGAGDRGFSGLTEAERRDYEKKLAEANHFFRSGNYGKAIAAYERIGEEYSDRITKGSHLLWIGAGWFRLKDYQLARKSLSKLVAQYKTSPWTPEAEFLIAEVDFNEGFVERSVDGFKEIIRKYPQENVAERAKEELKRLEDRL